jgi:hypothetical protein
VRARGKSEARVEEAEEDVETFPRSPVSLGLAPLSPSLHPKESNFRMMISRFEY